MKAEQQNTTMFVAATIDELPEVLVVSYDYASLAYGPAKKILIVRLRHSLSHREDIMPHATKVFYDRYARGLINDEPHAD